MIELVLLGLGVGTISGFFGIGGGTILVPLLLVLGFETKVAIGISVVQMVFSSVFGSYLNFKKGSLDIAMISTIGIGGFFGALLSGYIASGFDDRSLELIFLAFVIFALGRLFFVSKENKEKKEVKKIWLLIIGFILGALSMTIGVGGSILLVPILVGFWHVDLKNATSAGLFFVVFSSLSGLISHLKIGHVDLSTGVIIGLASLGGVYVGIQLKEKVDVVLQKKLLFGFYSMIVTYLIYRIFVL